ncbi:hypothetical protein TIFTF001_001312 [Ficus carica]|uniref:Uncharacterized protein n=1 Tax=Ficus carica TaxID=3494 RepID=A0AA87ZF82_FICCA|nr:hypothetical protein TIFTF001_001312 [Ficus carica]
MGGGRKKRRRKEGLEGKFVHPLWENQPAGKSRRARVSSLSSTSSPRQVFSISNERTPSPTRFFKFVGSRNCDGNRGDRRNLVIYLIVTILPFVRFCDVTEEMGSCSPEGAIIAAS